MSTKRLNLGFDLRLDPSLLGGNPLHANQHLELTARSPVSADPSVWLTPEGLEEFPGTIADYGNPLFLSKSLDRLVWDCKRRGISVTGLWPVCITCYESNLLALIERYGPGYFENQSEHELRSQGWKFLGFDVLELNGMISGLKGCSYVEPMWSQLRSNFAHSLNEFGLFSDTCVALQFAEVRSLEIIKHAPFIVVGVFAGEPLA